jgi:hypothetical protein
MKIGKWQVEINVCDECGRQGFCARFTLSFSRYVLFRTRTFSICLNCLTDARRSVALFKNTLEESL